MKKNNRAHRWMAVFVPCFLAFQPSMAQTVEQLEMVGRRFDQLVETMQKQRDFLHVKVAEYEVLSRQVVAEADELSNRIGATAGASREISLEQEEKRKRDELIALRYYSNTIQDIQKKHLLNLAEVRRLQSDVTDAVGEISARAQDQ
jgi:predicted RND superfamily exporter protein